MKQNIIDLFNEAISKKFGVIVNFNLIETRLEHLRGGKRIVYEDLIKMADDTLWPFSRFWILPSRAQIESRLATTEGLLGRIQGNIELIEAEVITELNGIFRNIGLASILLRFVYPENYGIYSPPVLQVARVERGANEVEDYINYLKELRTILNITEIKDFYALERVADVDMLLLAISQLDEEYLEEFNKKYATNYHPSETFRIEISSGFPKSIENYDNALKGRILQAIFYLTKKPTTGIGDTVKPLAYGEPGRWRYRIGDYRLIYQPRLEDKVVKLINFGSRSNVYE